MNSAKIRSADGFHELGTYTQGEERRVPLTSLTE
jgi:hypothetical protein